MNLFETVKASVSVPEAARAYGLTVTCHNMTPCSYHNDRHPSHKLKLHFYYCIGCGARGDVIDLAARYLKRKYFGSILGFLWNP